MNSMERTITVTLEKAKEWYNSDNESLKEFALDVFTEMELKTNFRDIKTFKDVCKSLGIDYNYVIGKANSIAKFSCASAAMYKLNCVRKALNLGYDLYLSKNLNGECHTWYPCLIFCIKNSDYYKDELESGEYKKIGGIKSEGVTYDVICGDASWNGEGLGCFNHKNIGFTNANTGLLGCATKDIAEHFGKYFGMLITEAVYGDMVDFKIVENKYQ